jgi:pyridoxine/pyridoxamine 5'-phosphate oxidase
MTIQETILQELRSDNRHLGVLSTVNEVGHPQSASMYYIAGDDMSLYFVTREGSRKYMNILKNPHVSFVVTHEHPAHTVQLEGIAHEVTDAHEEDEHFSKLISLAVESNFVPPVSQRVAEGRIMFIKMTPTWARVGNFETSIGGDEFTETTL